MSHYMTALAMKQTNLKPATKIVLYWIADHHNGETGECFPSINRLAQLCEMSRRSVETHILTLEQEGLLERKAQYRETGGKTTNSYILDLSGTPWNSDDTQNLRMGSEKSAHGDTQNLRMNNLVINNLGNKPNNIDQLFEEFWSYYPRKINKIAAKHSYMTALSKVKPEVILDGIKAYAESIKHFCNQDMKFVPHARTWLRQERWENEVELATINIQDKVLQEMMNEK